MALDGVLANIPGLGGYLAMEQYQQRQALGGLQGAMSVLQAVRQQQEAQRQAQEAPLRLQALQAQVQQAQAQADAVRKRDAFFADTSRFMVPGEAAVAPGQGVTGGMDSGAMGQIMGAAPAENGAPAARAATAPRFDLDRFVTEGAMQGVFSPEALLNRQSQLEERRAAREQRMQELMMRLRSEALSEQQRQDFQRQLVQMQIEGRQDAIRLAAMFRQGSGEGGGNPNREPFKFSIDGVNVQGWRDRAGNVFLPNGRAVPNYQPEITTGDQTAAQKRASESETLGTVNDMLNRVERITAANPGTVAGIGAPVRNAGTWLYNQLGGAASGNAVIAPNEQARQLRDSVLTSLGNLGRLSNQDRQRIEGIWGIDVLGSPAKINEAVKLTRQIINSRYAGSEVPSARPQPGGGSVPPPPPGFKVD